MHPIALLPKGKVFTFVDLGPRLITVTHHSAITGEGFKTVTGSAALVPAGRATDGLAGELSALGAARDDQLQPARRSDARATDTHWRRMRSARVMQRLLVPNVRPLADAASGRLDTGYMLLTSRRFPSGAVGPGALATC